MFGLWDSRIRPCAKCCLYIWKQTNRVIHTSVSLAHTSAEGRHYYEVLGVKPNATLPQIKQAFVEISKKIHPDINPSNPANHDAFVRLNEAYSTLSRAGRRRLYDSTLMAQIMRDKAATTAAPQAHWPDSQSSPQSPQYSDDQVFWDETIFHMRDRTKDDTAFYDDDCYYGVKGIRPVSNGTIVVGCILFLTLGFTAFLIRFKFTAERTRKVQDKLHNRNVQHLETARMNARLHGTEKQLELLHADVKARADSLRSNISR